jgi:hypothetical protein
LRFKKNSIPFLSLSSQTQTILISIVSRRTIKMKTTLHSTPLHSIPFHSIPFSIVCRRTIEMKHTHYSILIAIVRRRTIEMKILYKITIQIILISIIRRLTIEMRRNVHNTKGITYVLIVKVPVVRVKLLPLPQPQLRAHGRTDKSKRPESHPTKECARACVLCLKK